MTRGTSVLTLNYHLKTSHTSSLLLPVVAALAGISVRLGLSKTWLRLFAII
jgi:hypothetical protein